MCGKIIIFATTVLLIILAIYYGCGGIIIFATTVYLIVLAIYYGCGGSKYLQQQFY